MIVMVNHEIDHSRWERFEIAPSTTIVAKLPSRADRSALTTNTPG